MLDALQVVQLYLPGALSPTSAVVSVLGLAVICSECGAGAEATRLTAIRLPADAAVILHDRVQVGTLALAGH